MRTSDIFLISYRNASILGFLYLSFGALVELARQYWPTRWSDNLSYRLDVFPSRMLELTQLDGLVKDAFFAGSIGVFGVRALYGALVVGLLFSVATFVALLLWGVVRLHAARQ